MQTSAISSSRSLPLLLLAMGAALAACNPSSSDHQASSIAVPSAPAQSPVNSPLAADDISILFPAPKDKGDFARLIAVHELYTPNPQDSTKRNPIWPDAIFRQFVAIAASAAAQVDGTSERIGLPAEAKSIDNWYISGIRVDAGAPGLSPAIHDQFGQLPEIRLIIQPVTRNLLGEPKVHDIAGHLIFNFIQGEQREPAQAGCLPRPQADTGAFHSVVADLIALRNKLRDGQLGGHKVDTGNLPLGVHPGLTDSATTENFRQEVIVFLEKHLSAQRLNSMAIAGLPADKPAPWIFLSMLEVPPGPVPSLPNGGFVPVHGPTLDGQQFAQLLEPIGKSPRVLPPPHTNNLNPTTCLNAAVSPASLPLAARNGVATATLFNKPTPPKNQIESILEVIADPSKSHFFNTDCISCHTETRRSMELLDVKVIPGLDPAVLPNSKWDVRNFGWSPTLLGAPHATATRRTAAETAATLNYLNAGL